MKNCVSYLGGMGNTFRSPNTQTTNSWQGFTVNGMDFVSLDSTGEDGRPRNADGYLPPSKFLRLAATSDLLTAGTDVGIPFPGARPDIGALGQMNAPDPGPQPGIPALLAPTSGATIKGSTYTIRWRKVAGATRYQLQVAESSTFQNPLVNDTTITDTARQVSSLKSGTTYYVRVRARGATLWGNYSSTVQFTTTAAPPRLINPGKGNNGTPTSFSSRWTSSQGATMYQIQFAGDSLFQYPEVDDSTVTDTVRPVTLHNGLAQYYCRVRARSAAGWSDYSTVSDFTTAEASSVDPDHSLPSTYALAQNYPNPFNPTTVIGYDLPAPSHVRLELFNALGQVVREILDADQEAGSHELKLNGNGLASGMYFYRMEAGSFVAIKKLVLLK